MKHFLKNLSAYLKEKSDINYLYFSVLLIGLAIFSSSHFLLLEQPILGIHLFFLFYAFGQAFLEIWVFILISFLLKKWAPKWALFIFIATCFLLLLLHFTNFTMLRLLDVPLSYLINFLFQDGIAHLITGFQALNMNMGMIALIFLSLLLIPLSGILLYWGTNHITKKKPWNLSLTQITSALLITGTILLSLDLAAQPYISRMIYRKYKKTLPFGSTFLGNLPECVHLTHPIAPPRSEKEIQSHIRDLKLSKKPNIYFFVIETLRRDYVTEETAPHLSLFGQENINISSAFSNANGTHLSWFALLHSAYPFHWKTVKNEWKGGATSLQCLKELGYKIHVYSSADLRYFGMDKILFGENKKLADQIEDFSADRTIEPCDRDALCFKTFEKEIKKDGSREGNIYLFFLDSTHSEYSFPKDFPLKFEPIVQQIDYLTLNPKEIGSLKNRYKNAIAYIDQLMGSFFDVLKQENLYEDAVVSITGDHGEEFFEEGALFHGTHLNRYQTEVPIFLKIPGEEKWAAEATHIDIFPSILHNLTGQTDFHSLFDGVSIFTSPRPQSRVCVMQNGPEIPNELSIDQDNIRLHFRFIPPKDIYHQTEIEILSMHTPNESSNISREDLVQKHWDVLFGNTREDLEQITD